VTAVDVLKRKDAPPGSTWSGDQIFASWKEWEHEFLAVQQKFPILEKFVGKLLSSPEILAEWMEILNELSLRTGRLSMFARFAATVDATDVEAKSALGQAIGLQAQYAAAISFSVPEMIQDPAKLKEWSQQFPELALYGHFFESQILTRKRIRKGTPLVWMSDCYAAMRFPVLSKRCLMLSLCENAIHEEGHVPPHTTGTYWRLVYRHGLPDSEVRRYGAIAYAFAVSKSEDAFYPEWVVRSKKVARELLLSADRFRELR